MSMRTQVGIVGAGPAGLMLSRLLYLAGIESIVLESRSRSYVEDRIRAGLIEQWARDLLIEVGVGERMQGEGLVHHGIKFRFGDRLHHFDFKVLVGKVVTIYGQQEVVKDFIARQLEDEVPILFDVEDVSVCDIDSNTPRIAFRHDGQPKELECDFIGGCDGFHGITRESIPPGVLTTYERDYPFGWLGILSLSPPPDEELIYSYHERGFALYTMRSPTLTRLYFQCAPEEDIASWPDERVWQEFHLRLAGARKLQEGEIVQKSITPMRSFMVEPMQYGRLFLAGDAAHIVPPTGAKGMNLAFADVRLLARAIAEFYRTGKKELLDHYSTSCLRRAWKAQRFSWWMTQLLHLFPGDTPFDQRRQLAELDYLAGSHAASTTLAENYVGLPVD
jgi:p-hydroxybenzoate 3-monooxygenase